MSDEEEKNFCYCGTPLDPYDEDAFPKRRPISIEEQVATDAQGRRRFHGAFTGGFSAGFFNTVGSLEGWLPGEFKSTRKEKADGFSQKPEDFMDDEDLGEYGIAPQRIRATKEYSTAKKRSRQPLREGPIPGEPVLETLLTSGNETVGYLLLRNMGIADKVKKQLDEHSSAGAKIYGCEMPKQSNYISEDIRDKEYKVPEIYKLYLEKPKANSFGLGYQGLAKPHANLLQSSNLVFRDKNDKKISIGGQAFGVGAFEDEDDDIYSKEDMSNYDFALTKEKESAKKQPSGDNLVLDMFKKSAAALTPKKVYKPPSIPNSFSGIHKVKKSRFEPLKEEVEETPRGSINPSIRAKYLGEEVTETYTPSKEVKTEKEENPAFDVSVLADRFVSASHTEDVTDILEPVKKSETVHGTEQMRDAARMKMFGPLTRVMTDWHPCAMLCKRFNVPEPFTDRPDNKQKKRTKNLIFELQKHADAAPKLCPGISVDTPTSQETCGTEHEIKVEETESAPDAIEGIASTEAVSVQNDAVEDDSLPKDITEKIGVEEKVDLYKAVFLSSSESEDEAETEMKTDNKIEEFKSSVLSDEFLPKIRPIKEGILSNLDFSSFNSNNNDEKKVVVEVKTDPLCYGPRLPVIGNNSNSVAVVDKAVSSASEDEWIEKDEANRKKKSKQKRKEKRKKHKHKSNKHSS